jgi:hypoxanthine phosphoribosyltransferase
LINKYKELKYLTIFDEKVKKFIEINKENLDKYLNKYNDLIKESNWFDGIMDHKNFEDIKNSLTNNNFFNRKDNKIIVSDSKNQSIKEMDEQELKQIINEEMKKITEDKDLNNIWDKINKAFDANLSTRDFYGFIKQNPWLIPDLQDLTTLQKKIITSYFLQIEDSYNDYIEIYNSTKDNINNIETQAKDETNKTKWQEVIKIFNNRFFYLPYAVEIDNTIDSILGRGTPKIITKFKNSDKEVDNDNQNTLSEGEKRTLYLLHVIFDLEQLKTTTTDKILIIDDIVDSFDYKNKHAILEYINDTMNNQNIYLIILTHSFDLYRSIANIFQLTINYISNKTETETKIIKITENTKKDTKTSINPIKYWLELKNHKDFICSIPLIRNLLDYTENKLNIKLTDYLHYPLDSKHKDLNTLFQSVNGYLNLSPQHTIDGLDLKSNKTFYDLVIKTADIILTPDHLIQESESTYFNTNLQDKIIISIALRLLMEKKIIDKLEKDKKLKNNHDYYSHNQARTLVNELKKNYTLDPTTKGLIDIVNMISSNNIHINSFIYEPLIDINIEDLINRYTELENTDLSNLTSK